MLERISDNIVELSFIALAAFFIWGIGYLIVFEINDSKERYEACIAADKQYVQGSCVD